MLQVKAVTFQTLSDFITRNFLVAVFFMKISGQN
jgi:hypothetical protein